MTTVPRIGQKQVTAAIEATQWALRGDDAAAAAETRRRLRLTGPDAAALLRFVIRDDGFGTAQQRVRAAIAVLEGGGFLTPERKETELFTEPDDAGESGNVA